MARIIQLSDIHFGVEHAAALAGVADFLGERPYDLLLVTGDITQYGDRLEFQAASAWFEGLAGPKLFTPGNHDTPWMGLVDRLACPFGRYSRHFGPSEATSHVRSGLNVQALNTARGVQFRLNWSKGAIRPAQAKGAIARLGAEPGAARIVACHHPLLEVVGGPMTGKVHGGRRAAERFAEAGVDLILSGHLHAPFAAPLPFGDGRTYAVGCGTLSLRERGFAPSFNLIDVEAQCFRIQALAWTGSHFEPERTWAFDRRV